MRIITTIKNKNILKQYKGVSDKQIIRDFLYDPDSILLDWDDFEIEVQRIDNKE